MIHVLLLWRSEVTLTSGRLNLKKNIFFNEQSRLPQLIKRALPLVLNPTLKIDTLTNVCNLVLKGHALPVPCGRSAKAVDDSPRDHALNILRSSSFAMCLEPELTSYRHSSLFELFIPLL